MFKLYKAQTRKDLDFLLSNPPQATAGLSQNLLWLGEILNWILSESPLKISEHDFASGQTQALRVKWILHLLDRNPEWRSDVSKKLNAVVAETQIFDLLISGLHQKSGIFTEFFDRIAGGRG